MTKNLIHSIKYHKKALYLESKRPTAPSTSTYTKWTWVMTPDSSKVSDINQRVTLCAFVRRVRHDEEPQLLKSFVKQVGVAAFGILLIWVREFSGFSQFLFQLVQFGLGDFVGVGNQIDGLVDDAVAAERIRLALQLQTDLGSWLQFSSRPR